MQARYSGRCAVTGRAYQEGTEIRRTDQGWAIDDTVTAQALDQMQSADINLSGGSGYGCTGWTAGESCRADWYTDGEKQSGVVTIVAAGSHYYSEDGMSFGVGDESGHRYWAKARLATDTEAAPALAAEAVETANREAVEARRTARYALLDLLAADKRIPALPAGWTERSWVTEDGYPARGTLYSLTYDAYLYPDGTVVVEQYDGDSAETVYFRLTGDTTADLARTAGHKVTGPDA